jgi:ferredoxin
MLTLYFSGTGNSKFVAELFTAEMGGECLSIEEDVDFSALLTAADAVAFVYPIYASRPPRIFREFIQEHRSGLLNKDLIILCTQMGFSGDGARSLTDLLDRNTHRVLYAEHLTMPNNINNLFVFPRTGEKRAIRLQKAARRKVRRIAENIRTGVVKKRGFSPLSRLLGLIQGAFVPLMDRMSIDSVHIGEECTGCGLCVRRCPMHNLSLEGGRAAAHGDCTECYRCINLCPERAVHIYFQKKVKWQYRGPAGAEGSHRI